MDRRRKTWIWVIGGTLAAHLAIIALLAWNGVIFSIDSNEAKSVPGASAGGSPSGRDRPSGNTSQFEDDVVQAAIENAQARANRLSTEEKFAVLNEKGDQLNQIDPKEVKAIVGVIEAVSGWSKDSSRASQPRGFEPAIGEFDQDNFQYYAAESIDDPKTGNKIVRFTLRDREYRTRTIDVLEDKLTKPQKTQYFMLKRKASDPNIEKHLNLQFFDADSARVHAISESKDEKTGGRVFVFTHMDKDGRTFEERVLEGRMTPEHKNLQRLFSMKKSSPNFGQLLDTAYEFADQIDRARRANEQEQEKENVPSPSSE